MEQVLVSFKKNVEDYGDKLLTQLDTKLERIEQKLNNSLDFKEKLNSLDYETDLFKFEKRLAKIERQKFGCDFSVHNNGDN